MIFAEKKHVIIGLILIMAIIFGFGYRAGQAGEKMDIQPVIEAELKPDRDREAENRSDTVTVHVAGAVERPGVYTYPEGTRVNQCIIEAGPLREAELSYLNLAEIMTDQQQILVPQREQVLAGEASGAWEAVLSASAPKAAPGKVNINTAAAAVLERLPGVGPVTAQKIIDYRMKNGRFTEISELMKVSGIGEKKFSLLKDKVRI